MAIKNSVSNYCFMFVASINVFDGRLSGVSMEVNEV